MTTGLSSLLKGAYVIAHCGGSLDFQMMIRYLLLNEVLQMKRSESTFDARQQIVTAVINNVLKLVVTYAFVAHT